jgi:hypothetical protein
MGSNPSNFKNTGRDALVEQVSWDDAMQFCRKLTERERQAGRLPEGYGYTLPTEAQCGSVFRVWRRRSGQKTWCNVHDEMIDFDSL